MYKNQCGQLLQKRESEMTHLCEQVSAHLDLFIEAFPSAEDVARTFGMSERSFRRKLSAESSSFRKILDAVRYAKAYQFLRDKSIPISVMAASLGYAEPAAFNHAFQRWANCAPGEYRANIQMGSLDTKD